jgi:hypothetical protein
MSELSYHAMDVDTRIRKKIIELLDMKKLAENNLKSENNPIVEQRLKDALESINELIGKLRFMSLDKEGIITKTSEDDKEEDLEKGFETGKKLTEGDNAFQQMALENKDRIGESSPPIIEKAGFSTMAPKETLGEDGDYIVADPQSDKVKKDYSKVPGAFSTQHQIPGEMSNNISAPKKVDAIEEIKNRNFVTDNKEPFFEKQ